MKHRPHLAARADDHSGAADARGVDPGDVDVGQRDAGAFGREPVGDAFEAAADVLAPGTTSTRSA